MASLGMLTTLRRTGRGLRRRLGLTPMQRVMRTLAARGVDLSHADVLEVFGGSGDFHTLDYADRIGHLTIWEHRQQYEPALRARFAGADVHITDSFQALRTTTQTFDLVVVDNPACCFDAHCEHFDLFPDLFGVLRASSVLILNVVPSVPPRELRRLPYIFDAEHLQRRRLFYATDHPTDVPLPELADHYRRLSQAAGFDVAWSFFQRRGFVYYLVLKLALAPRPAGS